MKTVRTIDKQVTKKNSLLGIGARFLHAWLSTATEEKPKKTPGFYGFGFRYDGREEDFASFDDLEPFSRKSNK